jgi:hypothetical protein
MRDFTIEEGFQKLLNNNPDKMCINALMFILRDFSRSNIDTSEMHKMVEEKMKTAEVLTLPLPIIERA